MLVTTVYQPSAAVIEQAKHVADLLQIPYIIRHKQTLAGLRERFQTDTLIVASNTGPIVNSSGEELFFHQGMAQLRIKNMRDGKPDHMVVAMALSEGMSVLDCTLGLGTDAVVASIVTGEQGRVTGLEVSPLIALITSWGLQHFTADESVISNAMRRICVMQEDFRTYLRSLPDKFYDVVYFDPMFRIPVQASSGIRPLRLLADMGGLDIDSLREARRVARNRVVVKEVQGSSEFRRLGITQFVGGKYSRIQYGIIKREDF